MSLKRKNLVKNSLKCLATIYMLRSATRNSFCSEVQNLNALASANTPNKTIGRAFCPIFMEIKIKMGANRNICQSIERYQVVSMHCESQNSNENKNFRFICRPYEILTVGVNLQVEQGCPPIRLAWLNQVFGKGVRSMLSQIFTDANVDQHDICE
jgi:hypothetical protein